MTALTRRRTSHRSEGSPSSSSAVLTEWRECRADKMGTSAEGGSRRPDAADAGRCATPEVDLAPNQADNIGRLRGVSYSTLPRL
jgi:hypothetical protein